MFGFGSKLKETEPFEADVYLRQLRRVFVKDGVIVKTDTRLQSKRYKDSTFWFDIDKADEIINIKEDKDLADYGVN